MEITYEGIISNDLVKHTQLVIKEEELLTFYIDKSKGYETHQHLNIGNNGSTQLIKIINTKNVGHDELETEFLRNSFNKIDNIIDLDFTEMNHNNGSMLDIYHINYSTTFGEGVIGQAISQSAKEGSWWDIFWKDSPILETDNNNANYNTMLHEVGHILGLKHPFDDPFNPSWDSEKTIMSYNIGPNGWNTWFSKTDLNALIKIWGRENDLGIINYENSSDHYDFKKSLTDNYFIKTEIGYEDITGVNELQFQDKLLNVEEDIIGVFNLIQDINSINSKIYRLYNAAFGRFPDRSGLEYWIEKNLSGQDDYQITAESFIRSSEFINLFGEKDHDNTTYINNLYSNILDRAPDQDGFNYWFNQINGGIENRSELLMGFSESIENKAIFSEETGIF